VPVDKPFFGTMGLAPDPTLGRISSGPPGVHSGNMDNKDLIAGVRETIDFLTKRFPHLTREEAYMIASVAVDYHVTQVVDGTKGIHGMIPKAIFTAQR
jgi:acetamidase/formamidase